jgi:hypothetical protein
MNNTKHATLVAIFSSICQGKKQYTKCSVGKIIILLEKYHQIKVKRRWVFQCLAFCESSGIISRKKRYRVREKGRVRQYSSLIAFTAKGAKYLMAKRVQGAFLLLKQIVEWSKKQDRRWPKTEDSGRRPSDLPRNEAKKLLQELKERIAPGGQENGLCTPVGTGAHR